MQDECMSTTLPRSNNARRPKTTGTNRSTRHNTTSPSIADVRGPGASSDATAASSSADVLPTDEVECLNINGKPPKRVQIKPFDQSGSTTPRVETCNGQQPSSSRDEGQPFRTLTVSKANRVRFYRNGDPYFNGIWYAISAERFRTLKVLMEDLNRLLLDSANLPHGVRHIFTLDGIRTITSIDQFKDGHSYVCSSTEVYKPLNYLNARQPVWCSTSSKPKLSNRTPSSLSLRNSQLVREPNDFVFPRIITVIRNGVKPRKVVRHLLNKKTALSFDQVMQDITAIVNLDSGIVRRLFTIRGKLVVTLADFFGEDNVFIAYGTEKMSFDDFYIANDEEPMLFTNRARRNPKKVKRVMPHRNESIRLDGSVCNPAFDTLSLPRLPRDICENFDLVKVLGDGNTAIVYEAYCRSREHRTALKIINKDNLEQMRAFIDTELMLMQRLSSEHIVRMFDYWLIDDSYYISLELISDGDLFEFLRMVKTFNEVQAANLVRCLAAALNYLHERSIVHRDVKPENLLIYTDPTSGLPCLKLADFGLACIIEDNNLLYEICGTPTYVAPEILAELGYGVKVDVWSTGIILYVLLCGFPPFMSIEDSQEQLFDQILRGRCTFPSPIWDKISYSAKALILTLINLDVEDRYTAQQMLQDPWIQNPGNLDRQYEQLAQAAVELRLRNDTDLENMDGTGGYAGSSAEYYYSRRASMDELSEVAMGRYSPLVESRASFTAL